MKLKSQLVNWTISSFAMISVIAMVTLTQPACAWWSTGHMVVAEIAYRRLSPTAKTEAERLLKIDSLPASSTFQTASVWADDLKRLDVHLYDSWHYIDLPFSIDNTPLEQPGKSDNVEWAIKNCISILRSKKAPDSEKASMLKFLIHFVGDVHMPLHTTGRFSKENPKGDQGGNKFRLVGNYRNLHAYWDSGAGMYEDIVRPLNGEGTSKLKKLADEAEAANPFATATGLTVMSIADWVKEGFDLSKSFVYTAKENEEPNAAYKDGAQKASKEKVALAGYRLAAILNDIFK